ncbi:MAG: hypothetical protein LKE46_15600 [Clostridium sp.]|uniref:hypothetical protein n=1 Tax=Clostridium sp. TaxID=1506 RepID=UPI0025BCCF72|nr:hypothetical protein [Clostridium sp.]MCH3964997.1 hypothetical protein [Clostridium sp.]MCH3965386.1 hypothetical protein [Clostridium sp.]MCH3965395.1 hypothetical protein [Clostridium sp.]MCH3965418.1 hypothetical protein [Clostridium sp.]MCH3965478.1 hypothetical protein [Clostridium sp.]
MTKHSSYCAIFREQSSIPYGIHMFSIFAVEFTVNKLLAANRSRKSLKEERNLLT